jgi:tRNA modification GTPase
MQNIFTSTVAALSTARGKAGIAVIRVTGSDCFDIVKKVFVPRSGKELESYQSSTAVFGDIYYEGEVIDSGLCTLFFAPHSYTGENTAEISCHGNDLCASLVLSSLFEAGARPATAGEFTRRAFTNGKLTLTQAEAVAELIDAESTASLRLSNAKVAGKLADEIDDITNTLTDILGSVYAYIDYPDEDLADMSADEMKEKLCAAQKRLSALCSSYATGRAVSGGIDTAIVGLPNSGKSSLLNLLVGSERAIVTDIAGTTRDVITEKVVFGNITLNLSDTAGIRETDDTVEKIGVDRAFESIENAELVLALTDGSQPLCDGERKLFEYIGKLEGKNIIIVVNKNDISGISEQKREFLDNVCSNIKRVSISAKLGDGKDALAGVISELYPAGDELLMSGLVITGARVYAAVKNAHKSVCDAIETLEMLTQDVAGTDIERAISALSEADGRQVTEEIVNNIFSRFCVGK